MALAALPIPALSPSDKLRFWDKIANHETLTGCHEWIAARHKRGYGQFRLSGRQFQSHRVAYFLATGNDPGDLLVCHRCDTPACVNCDHLFLGTDADNMRDKTEKGRNNAPRGDAHHSRLHPERMARGEAIRSAKLKESDIPTIRADTRPLKAIGADYGVDFSVIGKIKNQKIWKHIA